jgi:hypothetical protein
MAPCDLVRTDVSEEHIASIFRVKDSEFTRFAAKWKVDEEGSLLQQYLHSRVSVTVEM